MLVGIFGIFVAMPIDLGPQTTIEWIDLVINFIILVPSSFIALVAGSLAVYCALSSRQFDKDGRFERFVGLAQDSLGIRRFLRSEFVSLGPITKLVRTFYSLLISDNQNSDN